MLWLAIVLVFSAIASFHPAWKASRLTVNEVLAYELQRWYGGTMDSDGGSPGDLENFKAVIFKGLGVKGLGTILLDRPKFA